LQKYSGEEGVFDILHKAVVCYYNHNKQ